MPHQWLCGFGGLTVQNLVTNGNGWVAPGLSPGTLTINGNYGQGPGGKLLIELGSTNPAACDHLVITNQATLDGNLTFRFINGFAPKTGDQFDFLDVGGGITGAFASLGLQNLAPGFQFELTTNGSLLRMAALKLVVPVEEEIKPQRRFENRRQLRSVPIIYSARLAKSALHFPKRHRQPSAGPYSLLSTFSSS